jgi:hypothetical protein
MIDSAVALVLTLALVGLSSLVTTVELITRYSSIQLFVGYEVESDISVQRRILGLLCARLIASITLIASCLLGDSGLITIAVVSCSICHLTFGYLRPVGGDGADQLQGIVFFVSALALVLWPFDVAATIACLFIAAQVMLSYCTTGWAKLASPVWRSGTILESVFSTSSYGHPVVAKLLRNYPLLNRVGTYFPILVFSTALLAFAQPIPAIFFFYLCLAAAFHVGTAVVMGLNNFALTFPGTFPTLIFAYNWTHSNFILPGA